MTERPSFVRSFADRYFLSSYALTIAGMVGSVALLHVQDPTVAVAVAFLVGFALSDVVDMILDAGGYQDD